MKASRASLLSFMSKAHKKVFLCVRPKNLRVLTVPSTVIKNASAQYVRGTHPSAMQQSVTCLLWQKMHRSACQFMFDVFVDRGDRASDVRLQQKDVSNSSIQRARTARKSCHAIRRFFARVCRGSDATKCEEVSAFGHDPPLRPLLLPPYST